MRVIVSNHDTDVSFTSVLSSRFYLWFSPKRLLQEWYILLTLNSLRPSDCWSNSGNNTVLQHFDCDVSRYQSKGDFNWNGTYFLIEDFGRVFLSEDGESQIIFDGGRTLYYTWGTTMMMVTFVSTQERL